MTYRVVQTVETFKYPAGKAWGPYLERCDADQRVATLRSFKGDGVIEDGEFGAPCAVREPVNAGGPGGVLVNA